MTMKNEDDIKNKVGVKNGGCLKLTTIFVSLSPILQFLSLKRVNEGGCLKMVRWSMIIGIIIQLQLAQVGPNN